MAKARLAEVNQNALKGILFLVSISLSADQFPGCQEFLAPLQTGLQICVKSSHHWPMMVSFCLLFVESFGNQSLQIPFDSKTRLKFAVKYLLLATQLGAMNRDISFNSQAVISSSADPSFPATACPEPLESLLLAVSSSSVYGSDPNTFPSKRGTTSQVSGGGGTSEPPKGKSKPGLSKKTSEPIPSTSLPGKPSVRDAVLLLSSLLRESLPFCVDSVEYALQADLREMIRLNFEPIQKKYFVATLPNSSGEVGEGEVVVPEATVTSLWRPTSDPLPSFTSKESGGRDGESAAVANNSSGSLYPNAIGYFLLAPVKDPSSGSLLSPSSEPFLTKALLSRAQLMEYELFFRQLKDKLVRFLNRSTSVSPSSPRGAMTTLHELKSLPLTTLQQEMSQKLTNLFFALRGIEPTKKDLELFVIQEVRVVDPQLAVEVIKSLIIIVSGVKICEMVVCGEVLDSLIAIVSKDRVCSTMPCERAVMLFLWSALRS